MSGWYNLTAMICAFLWCVPNILLDIFPWKNINDVPWQRPIEHLQRPHYDCVGSKPLELRNDKCERKTYATRVPWPFGPSTRLRADKDQFIHHSITEREVDKDDKQLTSSPGLPVGPPIVADVPLVSIQHDCYWIPPVRDTVRFKSRFHNKNIVEVRTWVVRTPAQMNELHLAYVYLIYKHYHRLKL